MTIDELIHRVDIHCEDALLFTSRAAYQPSRWGEFVGYLRQTMRAINEETDAYRKLNTPDLTQICSNCQGTGVSSRGNRPDDNGPHAVCTACEGGRVKVSDV